MFTQHTVLVVFHNSLHLEENSLFLACHLVGMGGITYKQMVIAPEPLLPQHTVPILNHFQ